MFTRNDYKSLQRAPLIALASLLFAGGAPPAAAGNAGPPVSSKRRARHPAADKSPSSAGRKFAAVALQRTPPVDMPAAPAYAGAAAPVQVKLADGKTLWSVPDARHDLSPAMRDVPAGKWQELGEEEHENPRLPFRKVISLTPDPVVQREAVPKGMKLPAALPAPGFNFIGLGTGGGGGANGTPPDINGSIGFFGVSPGLTYQYVQTVNTTYAVYTLNKATSTATRVAGYPKAINTLFTGFGGACSTQNSGDPIVLFDKIAGRWLISQFTSAADASGNYFQCVAVSQTGDATGAYYRYAFTIPNQAFGDYPHLGVWPDGYYMMVNLFGASSGGGFAAMDRAKMLTGAAATMQFVNLSYEGGHLPADVDGDALPPFGAPGYFIAPEPLAMNVYRMKVDWTTPANSTLTLFASLAVAPYSAGGNIPQLGSAVQSDNLSDRLIFRLAYRNFGDHETLVLNHAVDPGISGQVSGIRWYEIRLSGNINAQCPSYPCLYQQGTYAVADGRSRWNGSIATDFAGNMLLGYSASGLTAGVDNHSIRYTGRTAQDTLGTLPQGEGTLITGTANCSITRWGDYSSMSLDPADDCTFWYTNEYYTTAGQATWSTRIASASFPAGTGAGQCQRVACTAPAAPAVLSASVSGLNQIQVNWTAGAPAGSSFVLGRADGACGSEGPYTPVLYGATGTSAIDTTVQAGYTYSYKVLSVDASGRCQSAGSSGCVSALATGLCSLKPNFTGAAAAAGNSAASCGNTISWSAASSRCPNTPQVYYNLYRSQTPGFTPSAGNRIATCVAGNSYTDLNNLSNGLTSYYVVRAEDNSAAGGGPCGGGNEDGNTLGFNASPFGAGVQAGASTWSDVGGDGNKAYLTLNAAGAGNNSINAWRLVSTATDAGINHTGGGTYAYRNAGPAPGDIYYAGVCAELTTPALTVGATSLNVKYWERHNMEYQYDMVTLEYSRNGGAWTAVAAPANTAGAGCAAADVISDWSAITNTGNACGYAATVTGYTGPSTNAATTAYAHRCHQITGLAAGDTVKLRWRLSSDSGLQYGGFYLDDVDITNIRLANACNACVASVLSLSSLKLAKASPDLAQSWSAVGGSAAFHTYRSASPNPAGWNAALASLAANATGWTDAGALGAGGSYFYTTTVDNICGVESAK